MEKQMEEQPRKRTGRPPLRLVVDNARPLSWSGATLAEKLLDYLGASRGLRVVEFTYGPSRLGWRLQAAGCSVECVDLALYATDSMPLDWVGRFDLAVVTSALHQTGHPDLLLGDIVSCLRPGGVCGGMEPSQGDLAALALQTTAGAAGLRLVDVSELENNAALFWKGRVPALRALAAQPPAPDLPDTSSFMPLAA